MSEIDWEKRYKDLQKKARAYYRAMHRLSAAVKKDNVDPSLYEEFNEKDRILQLHCGFKRTKESIHAS